MGKPIIETQHQLKIVRAIKDQGGWASKWATQWNNGVPDILFSFPEFEWGLMFTEVKRFADIKPGWRRQIGTTKLQVETMEALSKAGAFGFLTLVLDNGASNRKLVVMPHTFEWMSEERAHGLPQAGWPIGKAPDLRQLVRDYHHTFGDPRNERKAPR